MTIALTVFCTAFFIACIALSAALVSLRRKNAGLAVSRDEASARALSLESQLNETRSRAESLAASETRLQEQVRTLIARHTEAQVRLDTLRAKAESDREELEKLQASFRAEFRNLANDILEEKSRQFKQTSRESMEALLKPFGDSITEFKSRVEAIYSDENQQRGALKNEIRNLLDLNRRITEETTNLTNALKGNSKVQGDWGEMILETILESSNLVNGIHYTTQQNFKDEEGNNLRPDVVLNLPDSKQIVIDSKVSLTAFVNYVHADDASERDKALKEHLRSVRAHVDELGCKSYQSLVNSPDFIIMFIPNEPAFLAALQGDPSIWGDAYRRKVIISSPTNLFALLKIVDDLWKRDNQSKNALAIAREGANLYDKFVGFAETLLDIGKNLDTASRNYEKAMGQLKTGKGNLIARSEKLREMGVKATKSLPSALNDYEEDSLKIE